MHATQPRRPAAEGVDAAAVCHIAIIAVCGCVCVHTVHACTCLLQAHAAQRGSTIRAKAAAASLPASFVRVLAFCVNVCTTEREPSPASQQGRAAKLGLVHNARLRQKALLLPTRIEQRLAQFNARRCTAAVGLCMSNISDSGVRLSKCMRARATGLRCTLFACLQRCCATGAQLRWPYVKGEGQDEMNE